MRISIASGKGGTGKTTVLMEIPFDRKIAETYSRGESLVEQMPEWKDKFMDLYHRINKIIEKHK